MQVTVETVFEAAMTLPVEDRAALANRLWGTLPTELPAMSDERRAKLIRRSAEHDANPDDVIPWEEVQAATLARLKQ